ncbi:hypothetical protein [Streptomyces coelicoflavus]|uniref:hypothetical protein n=1 Tax=Streptomyces coelicoflavus TaxID=285562 RepID=UPI0036392B18
MRTRATITLAAVLLLAATGCSSSDDGEASNKPAPATSSASTPAAEEPKQDDGKAALEKSVRDYTAALFSGDASGYALVSARCQKQMTEAEWTAMAKDAHQQYGAQKATGVKVDQLSGDLARVSYGAGEIPQFDREAQSWAREGGTWRWDACPSTS